MEKTGLIIFGSLLSLLATIWVQSQNNSIEPFIFYTIIIFAIVSLSVGTGLHRIIYVNFNKFYRWKKPTLNIALLNDMGWDDNFDNYTSWTECSPIFWKKLIEKTAKENKLKIKISLIESNKDFSRFVAIVNPYGGVYPERDTNSLLTISRIFNYVERGGLFVNVADIPGYYVFDPKLKIRHDAGPRIYGQSGGDPKIYFDEIPFVKKLRLSIKGTDASPEGYNIKRIALVRNGLENIFNIYAKDKGISVSSLFAVNYGQGKFLISLFDLRDNERIQNMLALDIVSLIKRMKT